MKRILILLCVLFPIQLWGQRFIQSVPNISALANVNPVSVQSNVWVAGYYSNNDGGQGFFQPTHSVTSTNTGTKIWVGQTGWSWQRLYSEPISLRCFGAKGDGTDDTLAVQNALNSTNNLFLFDGNFAVNSLSLSNRQGMIFRGIGAGSYFGSEVKSSFLYNGTNGGYIIYITGCVGLQFNNITLDGNTNSGNGVWFKNNPTTPDVDEMVSFDHVNILHCNNGILVGGGTGNDNYNQIVGQGVSFYDNNIAVSIKNANTEFMRWRNCFFINSHTNHFYATAGAYCQLSDTYLGALTTAYSSAIYGPFLLDWHDVWVELSTNAATLSITDTGGNQASSLKRCYFTNPGDGSGVSVYWSGGSPLVIESSYIAGKVTYNHNIRNSLVIPVGVSWIPAALGITHSVGTGPEIYVAGTFSGVQTNYTVQIVTSGFPSVATWKWKRGTGSYSLALATSYHSPMELGMNIQFFPGNFYVAGDTWTFTACPCGVIEISGNKPDAAHVVSLGLTANQTMTNLTETLIKWDTVVNDAYQEYSTATGIMTVLKPGWYDLNGNITMASMDAGNRVIVTLKQNGTTVNGWQNTAGASTDVGVIFTTTLYLNSGDTLGLYAWQNKGLDRVLIYGSAYNNVVIKRVFPWTSE